MHQIKRFSLESHDGPYEKWPLRTELLLDGAPTSVRLPGYVLLQQFQTSRGYIVITDCDCPFEEITYFSLISNELRWLSCRWIGWMYETFLLDRISWVNEYCFDALLNDSIQLRFTIRSWGIPYIRPRLKMQWLRHTSPENHPEKQKPNNCDSAKNAND